MYLKHFPSMMIESTYNTQYGYHHLKISADTNTMCFVEGMMFTCYYIARIYGLVHNQTDFILLPKCSQTSINKDKQRIYPGADAGSNRDLVLTRLNWKVKCHSNIPWICFNLGECCRSLQGHSWRKFTTPNFVDSDVDTLVGNIPEMLSTAEEVLGHKKKKQPWITNSILVLCDQKRPFKDRKS